MIDEQRINTLMIKTDSLRNRRAFEVQELENLRNRLTTLEEEKTKLLKAKATIDKLVQIVAAKGIGKIESIVSGGLRLVFGNRYSFRIDKKETAKNVSYKMIVKKNDVEGDPLEDMGGGVVNTIAFLLRVIMIKRFKLAKMIVLDESFNNVAQMFLPRVSEMLKSLSRDHGFNILAVTHQDQLAMAANTIYRVTLDEEGLPTLTKLDPAELNGTISSED